jgi:hypothetical protein
MDPGQHDPDGYTAESQALVVAHAQIPQMEGQTIEHIIAGAIIRDPCMSDTAHDIRAFTHKMDTIAGHPEPADFLYHSDRFLSICMAAFQSDSHA